VIFDLLFHVLFFCVPPCVYSTILTLPVPYSPLSVLSSTSLFLLFIFFINKNFVSYLFLILFFSISFLLHGSDIYNPMDLSAPSYAMMLELLLPTRSYFLSILFFSFLSMFILSAFLISWYLFCSLLFHTLFFLTWFYNRSHVPMTYFMLNPLNHLVDPTTSS
jgi:hypothetical protein